MSQEELIKAHFDNIAEKLQGGNESKGLLSKIQEEGRQNALILVKELDLPINTRIVDLGCGAGLLCVELLKWNYQVTGLDVSEKMIALARKNCVDLPDPLTATADFIQGSAEEMEFPEGSFDLVIATGLLEYLRWDYWALSEMHRILKPGGTLIVSVPNALGLNRLSDPVWLISKIGSRVGSVISKAAQKMLSQIFVEKAGQYLNKIFGKKPTHNTKKTFTRRFYKPHYLDKLLSQQHFKIIDSLFYGFRVTALAWSSDKINSALNSALTKISRPRATSALSRFGMEYMVCCRKLSKPSIKEKLMTSDILGVMAKFTAERGEYIDSLNRWGTDNKEYSGTAPREMDLIGGGIKNILVLSPHPDDELIGCGGTILRLKEVGTRVTVIQMTDGSDTKALSESPEEVKRTVRLEEARIVAEMMGFSELILWKEIGSKLKPGEKNVARLVDTLNRLQPEIIFVPFINDQHPDHVAANVILADALEKTDLSHKQVIILSYEVWSLVPPDYYCIIDDQFGKKAQALLKYRTAMKVVDYILFCESLHSYHSCKLLHKMGFLEVFFKLDAEQYIKLIERNKPLL